MRRKVAQMQAELALVRKGRTPRDRARILGMLLRAHAREGRIRPGAFLPKRPGPVHKLGLTSGHDVVARRSDGSVLLEQFALGVYDDLGLPGTVGSLVDVGANIGLATLTLGRRFPQAILVCVEPDPASFALLEQNLALNGLHARCFRLAVVGEPGSYSMAEAGHPGANRVVSTPQGGVEGVSLAELLDRAGLEEVDLVKLDIEGSEREVLAGAAAWAPRVRSVLAELHGGLTALEVEGMLGPEGYRQLPLESGPGMDGLVCFTRAAPEGVRPAAQNHQS